MMNKKERAEIFQETVKLVEDGEYISPSGEYIKTNNLENAMVNGTKFYGKKVMIDLDSKPRYETKIKVVNNDCIYEAKKLIDKELNPLMLNMASFNTPGGGVVNGASAQEENIFRRTNIFKSLYQFHYIGQNYNIKQKEERYPLQFTYGGIYTPKVFVFRGSDDVDYELLDEPFYVDVISMAAVKKPRLENGKLTNWVKQTLESKIEQMFNIALENGNDSLVLSAFGCGAYQTPPTEMAKLFADVIASEEYEGLFKEIHFAIIDSPTTNNYKAFKEIFG